MRSRREIEAFIPSGDAEYDVVVCGAGWAGLGAAVAASRAGARTLLLEEQNVLGGVNSFCPWMPVVKMYIPGFYRPRLKGASMGGVHELLESKLQLAGELAIRRSLPDWPEDCRAIIHPDYLQCAAFELLEESGCHYLLHALVTDAITEGSTVTGVVAATKGGSRRYRAAVTIDATGDADVAYAAGASTRKGRPSDGLLMPVTRTFVLANADFRRLSAYKPGTHAKPIDLAGRSEAERDEIYRRNPALVTEADAEFNAVMELARKQGFATAMWYAFTPTTVPRVVSVNNGGPYLPGNIDATDPRDLTYAERMGAQIAVDFVTIARKWSIPGLEDCHLVRVGQRLGVRQTRQIVGDYTLTADDLINGTEFADAIALKFESQIDTVYFHATARVGTDVPYRCMLPAGIEGLLVAGRCVSITPDASGGLRSQGTVMQLGQAAGVAAAQVARTGGTPREADIAAVQRALVAMGAPVFRVPE